MPDHFTWPRSAGAGPPLCVRRWVVAADGIVIVTQQSAETLDASIVEQRWRPRSRGWRARDPGQHLSLLVVDAEEPRRAAEADGLQMSQNSVNGVVPSFERSTDSVTYAHDCRNHPAGERDLVLRIHGLHCLTPCARR